MSELQQDMRNLLYAKIADTPQHYTFGFGTVKT